MTEASVASEGRTPKWRERLVEIVDEAAQLFAHNGYEATGVAELGEAVGLGRGALYYYIGSKADLLSLIHDRVMEEVLASGNQVEALAVDPIEKLRLLGIELIRIITSYPDHVWVFLHEYRSLTGDAALEFRRKRASYEETIGRILDEGHAMGHFRHVDRNLMIKAWLGMHNYTYIWYRASLDVSPLQLATEFHEVFRRGVLAAP